MFLTSTHREECLMHISKTPKFQVEITIGISSVFANINTAFFDGGIGNLDTIVRHASIFCTSWNHYSFDSKNNRCLCLSSKHMRFVIIISLLFSDSFFSFLMNVLAHCVSPSILKFMAAETCDMYVLKFQSQL